MDIRITIRTTGNGSTLVTLCAIQPERVQWHRITLPASRAPEAVYAQLHGALLVMLDRAGEPKGRVVELASVRKGG